MAEKDGILYIWYKINDFEFRVYCNEYEYLGCGYYEEEDFCALALKFKIKGE